MHPATNNPVVATMGERTMTETTNHLELISTRLYQAESILDCLLSNDHFDDLSKFVVAGSIHAARDLIKQGAQAAEEIHIAGEAS